MNGPLFLAGGDWNEPPFATGRYSPRWIADQTGGRVVHGAPGRMGRIDFVISDAVMTPLRTWDGAHGSDHDVRHFDVYPHHGSKNVLRGAIWNAERDRAPAVVKAELERFIRDVAPNFVLLQEVQQYHHELAAVAGYRLFAQPGRGLNQNAVLVADGTKATGFRVRRMAPWTWRTSGGVVHAPPYMPHVCLDGWLRVGSVHEMSRIDWRGGVMRGPRDRRRIRRTSSKRVVRWVELLRVGTWDR